MSPAMAAAAAVTGRLTDVRELGAEAAGMTRFTTLRAPAVRLPLANVDTDQLIPARFMSQPRADGYGDFLFHDLARDGTAPCAPTSR